MGCTKPPVGVPYRGGAAPPQGRRRPRRNSTGPYCTPSATASAVRPTWFPACVARVGQPVVVPSPPTPTVGASKGSGRRRCLTDARWLARNRDDRRLACRGVGRRDSLDPRACGDAPRLPATVSHQAGDQEWAPQGCSWLSFTLHGGRTVQLRAVGATPPPASSFVRLWTLTLNRPLA